MTAPGFRAEATACWCSSRDRTYRPLSQAAPLIAQALIYCAVKLLRLVGVVRDWRDTFFACGVSAKDIDYIAPAILPDCFFCETRPNE